MQKRKLMTRLAALVMLAAMNLAAPAVFAQDATAVPTAAATQLGETVGQTQAEEESTEEAGDHSDTAAGAAAAHSDEEHSEDDSNPLTPLGINPGLLCVHLLNFLIVAFILTRLVWGPAVNFLDARTARIQKGLEDAAASARARQNAEAEAEKVLADARAAASREIADARTRGEDVAKAIQTDARSEAERAMATARTEADSLKTTELSGMRDQVISVAVALAGRIIQQNLDAGRQTALVNDFLTRLPANAGGLSGEVEVTSALPLNEGEQSNVRQQLGAQNVTFRVDPTILGGLIVRSQDRIIDGSARSNLNDLSSRLS